MTQICGNFFSFYDKIIYNFTVTNHVRNKQPQGGLALKDYLLDVMQQHEHGLYMCELPTGNGKTYDSARAMKEYADSIEDGTKIIYITTMNKNLPEDALRVAYGNDELYKRNVLRLRSNFDEVVEKILDIEVPEEMRTEVYVKLRKDVSLYRNATDKRYADKEYIKELQDRITEGDRQLRYEITKQLKNRFSTKTQRKNAIRNDVKYKWIGKLYPAVFTDDYKILLMSVSKFMKRNSILIDASYEFLNSDLIGDAVIVIDEFDATKDTIQSELIEKSLAMKEDYIQLFRQIYRTLNPNNFSSDIRRAMDQIENSGNRNTFTSLMAEAREIAESYLVMLSIKTREDLVDQRQIFLFNDGSFHTVLKEGAQYIRSTLNEEDNRIDVFFEGKEDFFKNRNKEKDIVLYSLLREINLFLLHFRLFVIEWARNYMDIVNSSRNGIKDAMNLENAISSILKRLELTNKQRDLLMGEKCQMVRSNRELLLEDRSFYQVGMEYYEFEDRNQEALERETDINVLRTELFLDAECELKKNIDASVFYLEAPTGSGKSNTAMNLSFTFMKQNEDIRKIFYIYPFNTLVEQNMDSINKVFGENKEVMTQVAVVNSLVPLKERVDEDEWNGKDESEKYQRILLDRQFLNYPIVLSTHVMLFRTLFGQYKEDAFGFYQLCNSVIVLDEIQSYRNALWAEIITFFKGFAELLNIKIIIMSATLPNLEMLTENQAKTVRLVKEREKYFKHPKFAKRVVANYELLDQKITPDELMQHILGNIEKERKILVEFIKKASAEDFYKKIKEESSCPVFLMTGDSSIQDRKKIIKKIKEMKSVLLIATQVIEAGVDIDMDIGYKDISRLDSEEQFMGRVNRSAKRKGIVYFFDLDDASGVYGSDDVRIEEKVTLKMESMREILTTKDFSKFYEENILLAVKMQGKEIDSKKNLEKFFQEDVQKLNMPAIDKKMQLIDEKRNMLSVYLAREIIDENEKVINGRDIWEEYRQLLEDEKMEYVEKTVKLRNIRSKMNGFIYQLSENARFQEDEQIGDIYYIENGEDYFDENGILKRERFRDDTDLFI